MIGGGIWLAEGPGPAISGQVEGITPGPGEVVGAVHAIAAHPTDPDILYLGGTNGGVWKTSDATAEPGIRRDYRKQRKHIMSRIGLLFGLCHHVVRVHLGVLDTHYDRPPRAHIFTADKVPWSPPAGRGDDGSPVPEAGTNPG